MQMTEKETEYRIFKKKLNSMTLIRERTIPSEQLPLVSEGSANFCA
jgi:hypothetical protein